MKTFNLNLLISILLFSFITACNDDQNKSELLTIDGELVSQTDCKSFEKSISLEAETPDTLSCVEYMFDKTTNILSINHINAGFNCCPGNLYCTISFNNDTIIIEEHETETSCKCLCLYDLEIEITGVVPREYIVKIVEPYNDEEGLLFDVDLLNSPDGNYCAKRKNYPWGTNDSEPLEISGEVVSHSNCKSFEKSISLEAETPDTLSCVEYMFNETNSMLSINHINAGFNCCAGDLYCTISFSNDTIIIVEHEIEAICDCNCLYDLEIEITGIVLGEYTIKVVEPYNNEEEIIFDIDLEDKQTGTFCVDRLHYPWGMNN